jgi:hypothetical protein
MVSLYLSAKHDKEFWTDVYRTYAKDPKKATSSALAKQLRKVIEDLRVLESMG